MLFLSDVCLSFQCVLKRLYDSSNVSHHLGRHFNFLWPKQRYKIRTGRYIHEVEKSLFRSKSPFTSQTVRDTPRLIVAMEQSQEVIGTKRSVPLSMTMSELKPERRVQVSDVRTRTRAASRMFVSFDRQDSGPPWHVNQREARPMQGPKYFGTPMYTHMV